jgi:hypothetical protein
LGAVEQGAFAVGFKNLPPVLGVHLVYPFVGVPLAPSNHLKLSVDPIDSNVLFSIIIMTKTDMGSVVSLIYLFCDGICVGSLWWLN